jgi:hypothetical protein
MLCVVGGSYEAFRFEHRGEHQLAFNRWCATVGNALGFLVGVPMMLAGRRRAGAAVFGVGAAVLVAGHTAEGTLLRAVRDLVRHPVWSTRADFALAIETARRARR